MSWGSKWATFLILLLSSRASKRARGWLKEAKAVIRLLDRKITALKKLDKQVMGRLDEANDALVSCKDLVERHQEIMGELNAELQILREVTVPGLTEAHASLLDRVKAERADNRRRHFLIRPTEEEG